jgi:hypothetical protein
MNWRIQSLKNSLNTLASDAEAQLEHLRKLGLPGGIDELALEYDDIAAAADDMFRLHELDKNQCDSVKKLRNLLSRMSGKANSVLWTAEALCSAPEWKEVRSVAKECLWRLEASR